MEQLVPSCCLDTPSIQFCCPAARKRAGGRAGIRPNGVGRPGPAFTAIGPAGVSLAFSLAPAVAGAIDAASTLTAATRSSGRHRGVVFMARSLYARACDPLVRALRP